jgi:hypothetical protein
MLSTFLFLLAAGAAQPLIEPHPGSMTLKEVRAFDATLPRDHPYYIRCQIAPDTGSLIKHTMVCRTNRQWKLVETGENDAARQTYDDMRRKDGY